MGHLISSQDHVIPKVPEGHVVGHVLLDHMIPKVPEGHVVGHVPLSHVASQGHMLLFSAWSLDYN